MMRKVATVWECMHGGDIPMAFLAIYNFYQRSQGSDPAPANVLAMQLAVVSSKYYISLAVADITCALKNMYVQT